MTFGSRFAPRATRWAGYGATSAGQAIPFSSWCASTMQATFRPSPMPYEPMTMGWRSPASSRYMAPAATVKSVPSLKMFPTSMPFRSFNGDPHRTQASPSRAFVISAMTSGV